MAPAEPWLPSDREISDRESIDWEATDPDPSGPRCAREDPRVTRSKQAVIAATVELLRTNGWAATTIEGVAAASGVAKTTIYRHWPDRDALIFAAIEGVMEKPALVVTPSLRDDLVTALAHLIEVLQVDVWASVLPLMIDAAERDDHVRALSIEFTTRRRAALEDRVRRAVSLGEIRDDVDPEFFASELVGPLFYRRFVSRQALTVDMAAIHVDRLLTSVRPRPSAAQDEDVAPPSAPA